MKFKLHALVLAIAAGISTTATAGVSGHESTIAKAVTQVRAHADVTLADDDQSFVAKDVIVDADGSQHVRLIRSYKGLRVIGGDLVAHSDAQGRFRNASMTLKERISLGTRPAVAQAQAISAAEAAFEGKITAASKAGLAIYAREGRPQLVWDIAVGGVKGDRMDSLMHTIVSASSGKVIDQWDDVQSASGTGNTLYLGTLAIKTTKADGVYSITDSTRGNHFVTDMNDADTGGGDLFVDADNIWGDFTNNDRATVAADAANAQAKTWDWFYKQYGRLGIFGDGSGSSSRVHVMSNWSNAQWNRNGCQCMSYGDGDGVQLSPLVTLDIGGHEMTHGVTQETAGLIYSRGDTGGLNESMSDIFGTLVEFSGQIEGKPANYLVGERIYAVNAGVEYPTTALRYMFKPSIDGTSRDCYGNAVKLLDPHYSSGVGNHFFYLLAEGAKIPTGFESLAKSDLVCDGNTKLKGIGRSKAGQIVYRALSVYMTENTKYSDARVATLSAAADLYGEGSTEYNTVAAAWTAVKVN
jgi:Zn-dependent metalloprotease